MVPWVVGACVTPADGSPNIVGGAEFVLQYGVRAGVSISMHYCGAPPPMTLQGVLAAGGSLADCLILHLCNCSTGANWTCSVGLLRSLALIVLLACSDGADPCMGH